MSRKKISEIIRICRQWSQVLGQMYTVQEKLEVRSNRIWVLRKWIPHLPFGGIQEEETNLGGESTRLLSCV